jgi:ABC-type transport system involved in multi-copper enzyme maturation permease subunit
MIERLIDTLPNWLHPRFPLVANELRAYRRLDIRIEQLGQRLLSVSPGFTILVLMAAGGAIITGPRLFGFLLFPVTVVMVPFMLVLSELLLLRGAVSIPPLSAQMIAREIENGTWEPLLSTPLPRYQILLSKFSALLWNNAHIVWPIIVMRILAVCLILVEGFTLELDAIYTQSPFGLLALGTLIIVQPLIELAVFAAVGLLLSLVAISSQQASGLAWGVWLFYRLGAGLMLTTSTLTITLSTLPALALMTGAPHASVVVVWLEQEPDLARYIITIGATYSLAPLLVGILSLVVLLGMVQYRVTGFLHRKPTK